MIHQIQLLIREWIAQKLILMAIRVAPKEFALKLGKAILGASFR